MFSLFQFFFFFVMFVKSGPFNYCFAKTNFKRTQINIKQEGKVKP